MARYETFSTTADIGIRFNGRTYAELYANALRGLNLLLYGRNLRLAAAGGEALPFRFRGAGPESVLVNWLSAVVSLAGGAGQRVVAVVVDSAGPRHLRATLRIARNRRPPRCEIKAVTYHNLRVQRRGGTLCAAVVFDV